VTDKADYYQTLGVSRDADDKAMKSAFRKQAMKYHPDRNPDDPTAEAKFKDLNEAYSILSDPQKRAAYDRMGHAAFQQGGMGGGGAQGFGDFSDIFSQIFGQRGGMGGAAGGFSDMFGGGGGARQQRSRTVRGSDLRYEMEIDLEDAFNGKDVEITVPIAETCDRCDGMGAEPGATVETCPTCAGAGRVRTQQGFFTMERPCSTCGGQGEYVSSPCTRCDGLGQTRENSVLDVTIPAGVEDGTRIRLTGQGDAAPTRGGEGQRGDLYVFIGVRPHDLFERDGPNLYCEAPVPMTTAALGGEVEIPTIDGGRSKIKVPEGSQSGSRMRLRHKGMTQLRTTTRGDMYVELAVETPQNLTSRQRELLAEFVTEGGGDHSPANSPSSDGFLDKAKRFWDNLTD